MDALSHLAFRTNLLDRCGNRRSDAAWLAGQLASPALRLVRLDGDKVMMDGEALAVAGTVIPGACVFLGIDGEGHPWAAQPAPGDASFRDLRGLMLDSKLPAAELALLAQARSLLHWHKSHGFCAACGRASEKRDGGYRRHCQACAADHFPRTDPVVIIAVRYRGALLLGRQAGWPPGMYSTLAGFMEPGETIEDAARREVLEEAGITVGAISYVACQPWPFPSSLMIGLIGEAESNAVTVDPKELETARWFEPGEVRLMLERRHPDGLTASRPQAIAHALIRTALQSS